MRFIFSGVDVLLLGGSCRLALDLAEGMIAVGMRPTLCYRNDAGKARIEKHLKGHFGQYAMLLLDLSVVDSALLEKAMDQGIDYLVDFAQEDLEGLVASVDTAHARAFFEVNVANRCEVIQRVTRRMVAQRRGRMVYISSAAAGRTNPGQGFYAAAKCAVEALYRNVGIEMAGRGITTVTLRPGYVDAGRGRRFMEKRDGTELAKVPLGRTLTVGEVTDTVMFLLSDGALGFNATVLTMDGGLAAVK